MTNPIIEQVRTTGTGTYLPNNGETVFNALSDVCIWVEGQGYTIDGLLMGGLGDSVHTVCGMRIFQNGYVCVELRTNQIV